MTSGHTPFLLAILDGLALNPNPKGNALFSARTPTIHRLLATCPHTTLCTFGPRVGLPEGQMGNSEVGHLNIGGGRIVQQELTKINAAIENKELGELPTIKSLNATMCADPNRALHLVGLVSRGGVHSSLDHLLALIRTAIDGGARRIYVHAITDGRDRPPTASIEEVGALEEKLSEWRSEFGSELQLRIVSIIGRYFAMDRDKRWERTELAYDLFTQGTGEPFTDPIAALQARHTFGETDEFIKPLMLSSQGGRPWTVQDGDALLFFNFRADRMRQIVRTFFADDFKDFLRKSRPKLSAILTLTEYEEDFPVQVLFAPLSVKNHLGEVISHAGLKQLRIAETEKYAHVTYFFNGGVEEALPGETRVLVPSPRDVATYDLKPEMSAKGVCEQLMQKIREGNEQVFIVNFANCDMVGHTGNFEAAVKAVETVDNYLGDVLHLIEERGGCAIVTADHGNADQMIDYQTGEPHTFHTTYPVFLILVGKDFENASLRENGALCDIAPTICEILGIRTPPEMTGVSLLEKQ